MQMKHIDGAHSDRFDNGLAVRKEVLGDAYVTRSLQDVDEFSLPMQKLVTEYCWGEIWTRPGLERQERSLINLGMLCALNRPHELGIHVRGAINNGLSIRKIQEALLQVAIYCGVPAGLEAFRVAREVIAEMQAAAPSANGAKGMNGDDEPNGRTQQD
jgi:4-carboxymuconolactone decarboxylase